MRSVLHPSRVSAPPTSEIPPAKPHRRRRRWLAISGVVVLVLVALFYLGGGWFFSGKIYSKALNPAERKQNPSFELTVAAVGPGTVTIEVPADPGDLLTNGTWGLQWADGYGQVRRILQRSGDTVVREYRQMTGSVLTAGTSVGLDPKAFPQDPKTGLGIDYRNVSIRGELGAYPAWYVPGSSTTWGILVHGNGMTRLDMLRMLPAFTQRGLPVLIVTIRNDPEAPKDPSGIIQYGVTEWKDVDAAAGYAIAHGAQHLVMAGVSMGGGIVTSFLYRSPRANRVDAVVLDSPMLDFGQAVNLNAAKEHLPLVGAPVPDSLTASAKWIAGMRWPLDWEAMNYLANDAQLRAPILLFHGTADGTVPIATSEALAKDRPDLVTFVRAEGVDHVGSWNVDPTGYEQRVGAFLSSATGSAAAA